MPRSPRPFSTSKSAFKCSHCAHPIGVGLDVSCCPAGVAGPGEKSPHCLWCGEDLTTTRSFCNHHCSTSYHQDLAASPKFLAKRRVA